VSLQFAQPDLQIAQSSQKSLRLEGVAVMLNVTSGQGMMQTTISVSKETPNSLAVFREEFCRVVLGVELETSRGTDIRARCDVARIESLNLASLDCPDLWFARTEKTMRDSNQGASLIAVETGQVDIELGGQSFTLHAGDLGFLPHQVATRLKQAKDSRIVSIFMPETIVSPILKKHGKSPFGLIKSSGLSGIFSSYLSGALKNAETIEPHHMAEVAAQLNRLSNLVIADHLTFFTGRETIDRNLHRYTHMMDCIAQRALDPAFSVEDVARHAGISRRMANLVFARHSQTIAGVLLDYRLNAAALALRGGANNVARIAYDCGFSDVSTFHRQFKMRFGKTPARLDR
jgi:AraC-like DNA-binding protein